jgi:hypothetical protein
MLKTFKGGDRVAGGFYVNRAEWTMRVAPREGEVLPGGEDARYYAFPTLMLLVAAPLLSFAFVIFLPFIGLALLVKAGIDKGAAVWQETTGAAKAEDVVRPRVTK